MGESPPHVDGLLHLGAIAVILAAAYLGLDKFEKFRTAFETIAPDVARQAEKAKSVLIALDIIETEAVVLDPHFGMFWQYMVCFITGLRYDIARWKRILCCIFFIRRQVHIPLLSYFRRRFDVPLVAFLLVLSLVSFFLLVATTLDFQIKLTTDFLRYLFCGYIFVILWLLFSLFVLHWKLQNIDQICETCYQKIQNKMDDIKGAAAKILKKQPSQS